MPTAPTPSLTPASPPAPAIQHPLTHPHAHAACPVAGVFYNTSLGEPGNTSTVSASRSPSGPATPAAGSQPAQDTALPTLLERYTAALAPAQPTAAILPAGLASPPQDYYGEPKRHTNSTCLDRPCQAATCSSAATMPATHPLDPTSCAATHQPRPHHLCKLIAPCCCPPTRRSGTGQRARHLRHLPDRLSQDAHRALQPHRNVRQLHQEVPQRVHPRLRALLPRHQGPGPHSRMSQPAHRRPCSLTQGMAYHTAPKTATWVQPTDCP